MGELKMGRSIWRIFLLIMLVSCAPSLNQKNLVGIEEVKRFSAELYKIALATLIISDNREGISFLNAIAKEITEKCLQDNPKLLVNGTDYGYTWGIVPQVVKNGGQCQVKVLENEDFEVKITGNQSTGYSVSVNGF
jgi:hypothetical protein